MTRPEWERARFDAVVAMLSEGMDVPAVMASLERVVPITDLEEDADNLCPICGYVAIGPAKSALHMRRMHP